MKIIFLDVDGVLNSVASTILLGNDMTKLCPVACSLLKFLQKKTGAKIVISSTWRRVLGFEKTKKILKKHGISGVIDYTPYRFSYQDRSCEISNWFCDNKRKKITHYVIIDDKNYRFEEHDACKGRFVRTDSARGLDCYDVQKAAEILGHAEVILPTVLF